MKSLVLLFAVVTFSQSAFSQLCNPKICFTQEISLEKKNVVGLTFEWPFSIEEIEKQKYTSHNYDDYLKWVSENYDTSQKKLLENQQEIFAGAGFSTEGFDYFLTHILDFVGTASYLDLFLFDIHQELWPNQKYLAEFEAYILESSDSKTRVLFASAYFEEVPGVGSSYDKDVKKFFNDKTEASLKEGYILRAHIHNHPFTLEGEDEGGTVIPSGCSDYGDMSAYDIFNEKYGMEELWISNGLDTLKIPHAHPKYKGLVNAKNKEFSCAGM